MTPEQEILWLQIKNFELDEPNASLSFSDRLARENGWSIEYSLRAIEEYKRFMMLVCLASHPLTPSDQVDQVWHLHLLYTESYWIDFCQHILNRQIHHGPTKGGEKANTKFTDLYQKTKILYQTIFGTLPPDDIWPSSTIRFKKTNFQRIDVENTWIITKPDFLKK